MIHYLKTWPKEFAATASGLKTFELRKNDRDFKVGDLLCLQSYDPKKGYAGGYLFVIVNHILPGGRFGLAADYVAMTIKALNYNEMVSVEHLSPRSSKGI